MENQTTKFESRDGTKKAAQAYQQNLLHFKTPTLMRSSATSSAL
jgi:hypothetical protein